MHVTFTFMARGDLPLAAAWEEYFSGCEAGSYGIVVHTQRGLGNTTGSVFDGTVLPDPVQGDTRFSWTGTAVMYKAMRGALERFPQTDYVQYLSDSCAPVRTCGYYYDFLTVNRKSPSQSYFAHMDARRKPWLVIPAPFQNETYYHASQWITLSSTHSRHLLSLNQTDLRVKYTDCQILDGQVFTPEEDVFAIEILRAYGKSDVYPRTLTWTDFSEHDKGSWSTDPNLSS